MEIKEKKIFQKALYRSKQEKSHNLIEERVNNLLFKEKNLSSSYLIIINPETKTRLDLQELLPKNFIFAPAELRQIEYLIDKEKKSLQIIPIQVNLNSYHGTKNSTDDFYEMPLPARIVYGDLTKKGGLLSLMHEISHAWQDVYYENFGQSNFEEFYNQLTTKLSIIAAAKETAQERKWSPEEFEEIVMKGQREELKDMGVEIDEKMFTEEIKTPKEGEAKIFDTTLKRSYIIKSEKLNQLVADYERQERDAWAHAIKVLKFLRKKGIDLEPQLKTLSDFKEIIYRCLDSYQKLLEKMIESSTKKIRFAR